MKPRRIILIRHGESEGNINKGVYARKPDYAVLLTKNGIRQSLEVGNKIKDIIRDETFGIYYSPYFRTRQTMDNAITQLVPNVCMFKKEEPRIREQEYAGKLQSGRHDDDSEREAYGKFFYRNNGGESGADVYDRVSDFMGTLHRDFKKTNYPENVLFFSHGMTNRIFIMKFFHFTVEEFEMWKNPRNGDLYILELAMEEGNGDKYKLITERPKHAKGYGLTYEQTSNH